MAVLNPEDVTAVIVTRGGPVSEEIIDSLEVLPFDEILIWNNGAGEVQTLWGTVARDLDNLAVFGRYAAIQYAPATSLAIYVQDDDCLLPEESLEQILAAYEPGVLTANMPARFRHDFYRDHCLVGFGAVFDRDLPRYAFDRFPAEEGTAFLRTCDIVFTALTPRKLVDVPYRDMPWASAPGRMWTSPGHVEERQRMLDLVLKVRDA